MSDRSVSNLPNFLHLLVISYLFLRQQVDYVYSDFTWSRDPIIYSYGTVLIPFVPIIVRLCLDPRGLNYLYGTVLIPGVPIFLRHCTEPVGPGRSLDLSLSTSLDPRINRQGSINFALPSLAELKCLSRAEQNCANKQSCNKV